MSSNHPVVDSVSDATVIPRVGVAVLLMDHRGYVLIGKRIGSHGHGTLVSTQFHLYPLSLSSGVVD